MKVRFRRNRQLLIRAVGGEDGGGRCRAQRLLQSRIVAGKVRGGGLELFAVCKGFYVS